MRHLLLSISTVFFLVFPPASLSQDYWVSLPSPTSQKLTNVVFTDSVTGWVAGDSGAIFHTVTGGQSWTNQQSGITSDIFNLFMLNPDLGWAVSPRFDVPGFETVLLTTTNGGNEWARQRFPSMLFYAITFVDSLRGWMVGEFGAIYGTSDGGTSWFEATVDTNAHPPWELSVVKFFSPHYGYAVGGRYDITGVVWRTINGGESWHPMIAGSEPLFGIHFFDSVNVMCVGGDFDFGSGMIKTYDAGHYWDYTYLGIWGQASALEFRTHAEAWSPLGFPGTYMYSPDSGRTWTDFASPGGNALYDVTFPDSLHGYMVGDHGTVLRYNSSPVSVREDLPSGIPVAARLFQNYPNPFNPSTIISYELRGAGDVTISVYDVIGREVRVLREGRKEAGVNEVRFAADGLASGIYQYRLSVHAADGITHAARSMIVLR